MNQFLLNVSSPAIETSFLCKQPGLDSSGQWDVRGFYGDKFNDPLNFNLSENTVSLITAITTSFSLILFSDIVFRSLVRVKANHVTKLMVLRRHILETFSNPLTLFLLSFRWRQNNISAFCEEDENLREGSSSKKLRVTFFTLGAMGLLTILAEFVFIFLATNQNRVFDVTLDVVPVFEVEDRGCEFVRAPAWNACSQKPLTEKPGFVPKGALQICTTARFREAVPLEGQGVSHLIIAFNDYMVSATVNYLNWTSTIDYKIGYMNESGIVYTGKQAMSDIEVKNALLSRLERTNVTVVGTRLPRP